MSCVYFCFYIWGIFNPLVPYPNIPGLIFNDLKVIYNQYAQHVLLQSSNNSTFNEDIDDEIPSNNSTNSSSFDDYYSTSFSSLANLSARAQYPKFLAYSLLLNNIFLCINHSCNILIYTLTNPRFKKNLLNLLKSSTIWCCRLIGNDKSSLFANTPTTNVLLTPLTPGTPAAGGAAAGSGKIVQPRHSLQSSLKNNVTTPATQNVKKRLNTSDSESFKSSKISKKNSFQRRQRGDDENYVHYVLCFFCRKKSSKERDVDCDNQRVTKTNFV